MSGWYRYLVAVSGMYLRHPSLLILVGLAREIAISFDFARSQIVDYIMEKVEF